MKRFFISSLLLGLSLWWHQPTNIPAGHYHVVGHIASIPVTQGRGATFLFKTVAPFSRLIRLGWYTSCPTLSVGDAWQLSVNLKPPRGLCNAGGFNVEHWAATAGIAATGSITTNKKRRNKTEAPENSRLPQLDYRFSITRCRQQLLIAYEHLLDHKPLGGALIALAMGFNKQITMAQWDVLRITGTSHLFAISGLHVGLVAGFAYALFLFLFKRCPSILIYLPAQTLALIAANLVAACYCAIAGFAVSTLRSLIMLLLISVSQLGYRHISLLGVLGLTAIMVLLLNPWQIYAASFYLSFVAVGILMLAASSEETSVWCRWLKPQIVIGIGMLPLTAWFFQQVSLVGFFTNIIAIPWVSFVVVPISLLATIFIPISTKVSGLLIELCHQSLTWLWLFLSWAAKWPYAAVYCPIQSVWHLAALMITSFLIIMPIHRYHPIRQGYLALIRKGQTTFSLITSFKIDSHDNSLNIIRYAFSLLLMVLLFCQLGSSKSHPQQGELWLTTLDVGQGLACVIRTTHHCLVFDTGPKFSATSDVGRSVIVPFLHAQSIDKLDTLVVSHGDNDHIGGASSLLSVYPAERILTSVPDELPGAHYCFAGQHWRWDDVEFKMLAPSINRAHADNDQSCVLQVRGKHGTVLLTGDIEQSSEQRLVQRYRRALKSDVLVVPHHGSKTSSTLSFLKMVKPTLAIFSFGYLNRYHHPDKIVTDRYQQLKIQMLDTMALGAITVKLGQRISMVHARQSSL